MPPAALSSPSRSGILAKFLAYAANGPEPRADAILWAHGSYSKAWYQLAAIAVVEEQWERALSCLDRGLRLEPDHPEFWCERGYVLGGLKRHKAALDCYVRAAAARSWTPALDLARALRGQGVQLIDLERLDEAETALRRSLELAPDNDAALNELEYIEKLRQKHGKRRKYHGSSTLFSILRKTLSPSGSLPWSMAFHPSLGLRPSVRKTIRDFSTHLSSVA